MAIQPLPAEVIGEICGHVAAQPYDDLFEDRRASLRTTKVALRNLIYVNKTFYDAAWRKLWSILDFDLRVPLKCVDSLRRRIGFVTQPSHPYTKYCHTLILAVTRSSHPGTYASTYHLVTSLPATKRNSRDLAAVLLVLLLTIYDFDAPTSINLNFKNRVVTAFSSHITELALPRSSTIFDGVRFANLRNLDTSGPVDMRNFPRLEKLGYRGPSSGLVLHSSMWAVLRWLYIEDGREGLLNKIRLSIEVCSLEYSSVLIVLTFNKGCEGSICLEALYWLDNTDFDASLLIETFKSAPLRELWFAQPAVAITTAFCSSLADAFPWLRVLDMRQTYQNYEHYGLCHWIEHPSAYAKALSSLIHLHTLVINSCSPDYLECIGKAETEEEDAQPYLDKCTALHQEWAELWVEQASMYMGSSMREVEISYDYETVKVAVPSRTARA
ncbi:hypothetical protein EMMF5_005681 [Cystobasidiomycetes sp. EMM_F5]